MEDKKKRKRKRLIIGSVLIMLLALPFIVWGASICLATYRNTITPAGIIIHHAAVTTTKEEGLPVDIKILARNHKALGYGIDYWGHTYHIGYHYVILPDGTVQEGRPERCQGSHARGYNSYLGICLIGDFSSKDNPNGEHGLMEPTPEQLRALSDLTRRLREKYQLPLEKILRHRDVNPDTECPGDRLPFNEFLQTQR